MASIFIISIVLNFNRRSDTLECLGSLYKNTYQHHAVIVLDNQSTDGSVQAIQADYPGVQIIPLTQNLGYAGNNNVGIQAALEQGADWIFVLNEDTILDPECIAELVAVGESNPSIGIVGPMVYHHDEPEMIQSAGGALGRYWNSIHLGQNERDCGQWPEPHPVEWISGCGIMLRRGLIEDVGMLDERFFYYWEETEWCLRARKAGWQILHVPKAKLWHKGVQRNYHPNPSVTYFSTRNHLLMLAKHHAPLSVWMAAWFQLVRTFTSWSIKPKWRSMRKHRDAMWRGFIDFMFQRWGGPVQL
jgi:GT2 family glycosyltransferase